MSVIVSRDDVTAEPNIYWMASVSLAGAITTNKVAEYKALVFGLWKAIEYHLRSIHVVGAINLIVRQSAPGRRPENDILNTFIANV